MSPEGAQPSNIGAECEWSNAHRIGRGMRRLEGLRSEPGSLRFDLADLGSVGWSPMAEQVARSDVVNATAPTDPY